MSVFTFLNSLSDSLRPDPNCNEAAASFLDKIHKQISLHQYDADAVIGGSFAKGTALADDHDIDVFVRFNPSIYEGDELSDLLENVLRPFRCQRVHGSRDYFIYDDGVFSFDIVPVLRINDPKLAENITDISPLHVQFFLAQKKDLTDEIRLAKQFIKSAQAYGAESYIRGFSGHLVDLLILYYGSFYEFVKAASQWNPPVVLSLKGTPNVQYNDEVMLFSDPVQPDRNAAAALSLEKLDLVRSHAKSFLRSSTKEHFVIPKFSLEEITSQLSESHFPSFLLSVHLPSGLKRDVAGARVRKFAERLEGLSAFHELPLQSIGWHFEHNAVSYVWVVFGVHSLSRLKEHVGPPLTHAKACDEFKRVHPEAYVQDNRLVTKVTREVQQPTDILSLLEQQSYEMGLDFSWSGYHDE